MMMMVVITIDSVYLMITSVYFDPRWALTRGNASTPPPHHHLYTHKHSKVCI